MGGLDSRGLKVQTVAFHRLPHRAVAYPHVAVAMHPPSCTCQPQPSTSARCKISHTHTAPRAQEEFGYREIRTQFHRTTAFTHHRPGHRARTRAQPKRAQQSGSRSLSGPIRTLFSRGRQISFLTDAVPQVFVLAFLQSFLSV